MRDGLDSERIGRVETLAREAMLVSCVRCEMLHPPMQPLAFHPICTACA